MKASWVRYLKEKGSQIISEDNVNNKSFRVIEDILQFKKHSEELIAKVFLDK